MGLHTVRSGSFGVLGFGLAGILFRDGVEKKDEGNWCRAVMLRANVASTLRLLGSPFPGVGRAHDE